MTHLGGITRRRASLTLLVATALVGSVITVPGLGGTATAEPVVSEQGDRYPFVCTTAREGLGQVLGEVHGLSEWPWGGFGFELE